MFPFKKRTIDEEVMKIQFLGATKTVTGSKYLIKSHNLNILVDCGLFQGYKELRLRNWTAFPLDPSQIQYVLLTHAHIDHSGYIPLLVKNGFRGKIICSEATRDLCAILLPDCGHLQEEEARYANLKGYSKHKPALPLYTREEAEASLSYFQTTPFDKKIELGSLQASFHYAGHILGASLIRVKDDKTSILFSGDLGRPNDPIMRAPVNPPASDYFVVESTYGNRIHPAIDMEKKLGEIVNRTVKRGGIIVIPAFAVGRAQLVLYYLHQLKIKKIIPDIPVYIDSPMATNATQLFCQYSIQHRLTEQEAADVCSTAHYIHSVDESKALNDNQMPKIIISASGMATGGRVLHHIKNLAPNHRNTIIFCGYQAGGTRGDQMMRGEPVVKIFGQLVSIHAEIEVLENISAHADYTEMLAWIGKANPLPKKIFITHGEDNAAHSLKEKIEREFKIPCIIPDQNYSEQL